VAAVATLAACAPAVAAACPDESALSTQLSAKRFRAATLCVMNRARAKRGLRAFRRDARLERAAQAHAADMVRRDYVGHIAPGSTSTFTDRVRTTGYIPTTGAWSLGEAFASPLQAAPPAPAFSARGLVTYWLKYVGPRSSLLSSQYKDVGIGVAPGSALGPSTAGDTYDADFGYRPRG
jgi:uncharacterized protein YkwD